MRKLILFIVVVLAIGGLLGQLMLKVPGYWLIRVGDTSIQTSFWVGLVVLFVAFVVLYLIVRLLGKLRRPFYRTRMWTSRNRHRQALKRTVRGLVDLSEGRWKHAQKILTRAANDSSVPLVNYLSAALAAHYQGDYEQADTLIKEAHDSTSGADSAIGLVEAQMLLDRREYERAIQVLKKLEQHAPDHPQILRLLQRSYIEVSDWEGVRSLLPRLKRYNVVSEQELVALEKKTYTELFKHAEEFGNSTAVSSISHRTVTPLERAEELRRDLPSELQEDPEIIQLYVSVLAQNDKAHKAEGVLSSFLKHHWNGSLVLRYGLLDVDSASQLKHAEGWLKEHPEDPDLLLTLGRLSLRNSYWGKAQEYFEKSQRVRPSGTASAELARLYFHLGESNKSELYLKRSAELLNRALPNLPQPVLNR